MYKICTFQNGDLSHRSGVRKRVAREEDLTKLCHVPRVNIGVLLLVPYLEMHHVYQAA
jgi:hypothetical protein